MFIKGQQVWCPILGKGVVVRTDHGVYPIKVRFESGEVESFASEEDLVVRHGNRALLHHPVKSYKMRVLQNPQSTGLKSKRSTKWLAADANEYTYVFKVEPELDESGYWCSGGRAYFSVKGLASYVPGTCDWKDSLVKRPETDSEGESS